MGLYRVSRTEAQAVLGCGHDVKFQISDLRVRKDEVRFPPCPECNRSILIVRCILRDSGTPAGVLERDTAIHTLHERVQALKLYMDGAKPEEVRSDMHTLARKDAVVEAPSAKRA